MTVKKFLISLFVYMFVFGVVFMTNIEKPDRLVELNWGLQIAAADR